MKKGLTELVLLLDKSGSMEPATADVIGGFKKFIEDQKALPGEATMTLVQFSDTIVTTYENKNINDVGALVYSTVGRTALLEAACTTIDKIGERLGKTTDDQRPEKIIFAIMTDGEENASGREFTSALLKEKIKHQTEVYNWSFLFMGANIDAFKTGDSLGVAASTTRCYQTSGQLGRAGMADYSSMVCAIR